MAIASRRGSTTSLIPPSPSTIKRPGSAASIGNPTARPLNDVELDVKNVRVVLRIRPAEPDDSAAPLRFRNTLVHPTSASDIRVDVDPAALAGQIGSATANGIKKHPTFSFDHVLSEASKQTDVYAATGAEVIDDFIKGHNVTFLAYGQTSSGKSYTMGTTGDDVDYSGTEFTPRTGVIPRTVHAIFERAEELRQSSGPGATWECRLSFLELYNEEILDLLSGAGVQIAIREEKDGRIIWSGVREVRVKTLADVMDLLQEGSTRRKTGATGMNATSSRSHAIFSLTLVQKRRAGLFTNGEPSSSRIKRPNSMMGFNPRSTAPSGNRSNTPNGSRGPPTAFSTQHNKTSLPRPNSIHVPPPSKDDEVVIVTSKFNMVDLAGSERLKRTAAQGERMKEGISINSGLLALGNVISTLADPMKAKGHIPYRDSKLTRLLQDSVGGNALTTMIACVSPIEFNIGETLNTIKYAQRARNIRNVAKVNQVEAGWDDVEHLQNTVLKLRKQIAETGGELKSSAASPVSEQKQQHSQKLLSRLAELQKEHTELYDRYLAKCSENMRLSSEMRNARPGEGDALAKFNETVEPVILEYEKVVSVLNLQLDELRNEIATAGSLYEVQGQSLREAIERQSLNDTYVLELRGRLTKLTERNTASEGYIRDLEVKLKNAADKEGKHEDIVATLRKEIANHQLANTRLSEHTAELETRLVSSDARATTLASQIEKHERHAERRDRAYKDLESHIALLDTTEDNRALLEELQERDSRISDIERVHQERESRLEQELADLTNSHEARSLANSHLRAEFNKLSASSSSGTPRGSPLDQVGNSGPADYSCVSGVANGEGSDGLPPPTDEMEELRRALRALTAKYQDSETRCSQAENRIANLTTQLGEARLVHAEFDDVLPPSPNAPSSTLDEASDESMTLHTHKDELETLDTSPTKPSRNWNRGSMPIISTLNLKGRDFRLGRGVGESRRGRPQSLSQELSSAQQSFSSRSSWTGPNTLLLAPSPSRSNMPTIHPVRSMQSLEAELKFVHQKVNERDEELRDRETYIKQLETTLQDKNLPLSMKSSSQTLYLPQSIPLPPSPTTPTLLITTIGSPAPLQTIAETVTPVDQDGRISALSRSLSKLEDGPITEPQMRVDDLMRIMASKEAALRQTIAEQDGEIQNLQKSNKRLKEELFAAEPASPSKAKLHMARVEPSKSPVVEDDGIEILRQAHNEELEQLVDSHSKTVARLQSDHNTSTAELRIALEELRNAAEAADTTHARDVNAALVEKDRVHAEALANLEREHEAMVTEMEASLAESEEQRRQLKMRADQAMFELSRIRDEGQLQQNHDLKQITDLKRVNSTLEKVKAELVTSNNELSKKVSEMESRHSRRPSPLPPQGPPPTSPLPPIPKSPSVATAPTISQFASGSSLYTASGSSQGHQPQAGQRLSNGSLTDIQAIIATLPEGPQQNVQKVVSERDTAIHQKDLFKQQLSAGLEKLKDAESKWIEEKQKSESLGRDLAEARKTSSKLRVHLEDTRSENRQQIEQCKNHTSELESRRSQVSKLSEETQASRASLQAANAQVATLKSQLDRAVEQKVQKRLLKCF